MILCSRAMSWAEARRLPSGGRRSAQRAPARVGDRVGQVRAAAGDALERERRLGPGDVLGEPGLEARLVDSLVGHGRQSYAWRSVITPGCWSTSAACSRPRSGTASRPSAGTRAWRRTRCSELFREDPEALADLRELETGRIAEDEFERRFAERLGLDDADRPDRQHVRGMKPSEPMVAAVRGGAGRRRADRPGLELVEHLALRPRPAGRAVRRRGDLGGGGPAQAAARDLPAGVAAPRRRARAMRVRRRPARELRGRRGRRHDRDPPPRRGRHGRAARGAAGLHGRLDAQPRVGP